MRINRSLTAVALAATMALAPAVAATPAAAAPARGDGLVNVFVKDVLNGNDVAILNNVAVSVAAAVCDVTVEVIKKQLADLGEAECPAKSTVGQRAYIKEA
ncbi:hypothetical protein [Pilimelia anulata]|nr:hypothetical protein [Pilimelia anulata]